MLKMKVSYSFALASTLVALGHASPFEIERRGCGNNCARGKNSQLIRLLRNEAIANYNKSTAVIASNFPQRPTKADCSSYVAVTVTPATV